GKNLADQETEGPSPDRRHLPGPSLSQFFCRVFTIPNNRHLLFFGPRSPQRHRGIHENPRRKKRTSQKIRNLKSRRRPRDRSNTPNSGKGRRCCVSTEPWGAMTKA